MANFVLLRKASKQARVRHAIETLFAVGVTCPKLHQCVLVELVNIVQHPEPVLRRVGVLFDSIIEDLKYRAVILNEGRLRLFLAFLLAERVYARRHHLGPSMRVLVLDRPDELIAGDDV